MPKIDQIHQGGGMIGILSISWTVSMVRTAVERKLIEVMIMAWKAFPKAQEAFQLAACDIF